jgi:hypothetical protein
LVDAMDPASGPPCVEAKAPPISARKLVVQGKRRPLPTTASVIAAMSNRAAMAQR